VASGSLIHRVLYAMEEDGLTPDQALERFWPADLDPSFWDEARTDLTRYMERGASPMDRFGTVAVETELDAVLYVDEDYGPVHYRGILDWLGVDMEQPSTLHAVDYKTNRHPPSRNDVRGDVQLKGYAWLVEQNWRRWMPTDTPNVVMHLDAVKYREIEMRYDTAAIESWHSWAVAVTRQIWRDEEAEPIINPGCDWCPVKGDCPAFLGLPGMGQLLADRKPVSMEERYAWRVEANRVRLLLENRVKEIDREIQDAVRVEGERTLGGRRWYVDDSWKNEVDLRALRAVMDEDDFLDVVSTSKSRLEEYVKDWPASRAASVLAAIKRVQSGTAVKSEKVDG
jgi:RecB family exonuclease